MKVSNKIRIAVTDRDRRLLGLLYRFGLLSRDQLMLAVPFGSLTRANTRLGALLRARLVSRKQMPIYPGKGSAQSLYFLGGGSLRLGLPGIDPAIVAKQIRQIARWNMSQVDHCVRCNQVLIDFEAGVRSLPQADLVSFRTEPELRRVFLGRNLVPDGWVGWIQQGKRFNCFLEVDLNHEGLTQWRRKILEYLKYAESGLHTDLFGLKSFRVVVLAKTRVRLENIARLARAAGRLFVFAEIGTINSKNILGPVWLPASGGPTTALVDA